MSATVEREAAPALLDYITAARWFAGKGRRASLGALTPLPWLTRVDEWPAVRFEIVAVTYRGDDDQVTSTELYQLAIAYRSAPEPSLQHAEVGRFDDPDLGAVVGYDAMQDPAACRLVLDRLRDSSSFAEGSTELAFHLLSAESLDGELEPQIYTGQQSNTSVMYGDVAMLKLFRRIEIGHNLDIEVHESLSRSGVADVAQLYGWVSASWPGPVPGETLNADLAMMVQKLADAEDGWQLALDELGQGRSFAGLASDLGAALAQIHEALRSAFGSDEVSGARTAEVMRRRLVAATEIAPALEPHLAGLNACFDQLADAALATQRVHGDFHLGQTLHTPTGWKIIDFEGEPVKSLAERAEPDSVWRDIAGMLRSFDYAAASIPGPSSQDWADECRAAFLQGYAGGRLSTADEAVLRAYIADKAIYEVVYELRNRPDWVNIPLAAVAAITTTQPAAAYTKE